MSPTMKIDVVDDEGYERTAELAAHYIVCPRCDGKGVHDHPAFANGITADEWYGPDWDEDDRAAYLSGAYDVRCEECNGQRVVLEPSEAACDPNDLRLYHEKLEAAAEIEAAYAAERRAGA